MRTSIVLQEWNHELDWVLGLFLQAMKKNLSKDGFHKCSHVFFLLLTSLLFSLHNKSRFVNKIKILDIRKMR